MSFNKGVREAFYGILISFIPILILFFSNNIPNAYGLLGALELLAFIDAINKMEIVHKIPWLTALGYFSITLTVGKFFMVEWEWDLQLLCFIVYIIQKIKL